MQLLWLNALIDTSRTIYKMFFLFHFSDCCNLSILIFKPQDLNVFKKILTFGCHFYKFTLDIIFLLAIIKWKVGSEKHTEWESTNSIRSRHLLIEILINTIFNDSWKRNSWKTTITLKKTVKSSIWPVEGDKWH